MDNHADPNNQQKSAGTVGLGQEVSPAGTIDKLAETDGNHTGAIIATEEDIKSKNGALNEEAKAGAQGTSATTIPNPN